LNPDRRLNFSYFDGPSDVMAATREILRQGATFIKMIEAKSGHVLTRKVAVYAI
jgi:hypothetical protein